jgi:hypothetical protein
MKTEAQSGEQILFSLIVIRCPQDLMRRYDDALPPLLFQESDEPSTTSDEAIAIALIGVIGIIGGSLVLWICADLPQANRHKSDHAIVPNV